jgi:hypothetical protein
MTKWQDHFRVLAMSESDIKIHTRVGNDYRTWAITAQALFAGSTILTRERERARENMPPGLSKAPIEMRTLWIELMLAAFGIECLIKAIWIKKGHQLARNGKYIEIILNERHRLVPLCQAATLAPQRTRRSTDRCHSHEQLDTTSDSITGNSLNFPSVFSKARSLAESTFTTLAG